MEKVRVLIATFSYGGNGGIRSEVPDVRDWLLETVIKAKKDDRIADIAIVDFADTPITMCRNAAVKAAMDDGFDFLLMIDSDMRPDMYHGRTITARPFWDSSFAFCYETWLRGRHEDIGGVCVGAPYCGPPPMENVYVFLWRNWESQNPNESNVSLEQYSREEAAALRGIKPVAALPTGLILFDTRLFKLTEPRDNSEHSWFYYEYTDKYETQKASTEDVTATRDLSLIGLMTLGYNPVYCNWDAWAGHWKPKCVGKPQVIYADQVGRKLARAVLRNLHSDDELIDVSELTQPTESEQTDGE